jgi:hypothetical protein
MLTTEVLENVLEQYNTFANYEKLKAGWET